MGVLENLRKMFARSASVPQASYAQASSGGGVTNVRNIMLRDNKRSAKLLRHWAEINEFVRVAINRRKKQIAMAKWKVVRIDDPKASPDPRVEKTVRELFNSVNKKGESFRALMEQVVEDVLVLDAGCIFKHMTLGGDIYELLAVDGATIVPDPNYTGDEPNAIRYRQFIGGVLTAELTNDQLLYIMANPRTHSAI